MSAKDQINQIVDYFKREPQLKDKTDGMAEGLLLGAILADEANERSKDATETTIAVQEKYKEQILAQDLNPNKDPELVDIRDGSATAGERIRKFEQETNRQLADTDASTNRPSNQSVWTEFTQRGINPLWMGAKGDGETNDSAPVSNVLSMFLDIDFMGREYYLEENIVINSPSFRRMVIKNAIFRGDPTKEKATLIFVDRDKVRFDNCEFIDCGVVVGHEDAAKTIKDIVFRDCRANTQMQNLTPFDIKAVEDCHIDNLTVRGTYGVGVLGSGIKFHNNINEVTKLKSKNVTIKNTKVSGFYRGIDCLGTGYRTNFVIDDNTIEDCELHAIFMYHTEGGRNDRNRVLNCGYGIWFDGGALGNSILPQSCSDNTLNNITKGYGIYVEETHGAKITGNNIRNCKGVGIVLSSGNEYTKVTGNIIKKARIGISVDHEYAPAEIQGYFNLDLKIGDNIIENTEYDGIFVRRAYRSLKISENLINSCNTSNSAYGFAINVEQADSVDVLGNTLNNQDASTVEKGYQSAISIGVYYNYDRSSLINSVDVGKVNINNNTGVGIEKYSLYLGNTGVSQGVNTAGIINGNSFTGNPLCVIRYPNTFVFSGNLGLGEFSALISHSGDKLMKLTKGVTVLPNPSVEYEGCIAKMPRTTTKDTSYHICVQTVGGSYAWKVLSLQNL